MTSLSRLADMLILMMSVVLFVPKLVVRIVHDVLYRYYPESIGPTPQYVSRVGGGPGAGGLDCPLCSK